MSELTKEFYRSTLCFFWSTKPNVEEICGSRKKYKYPQWDSCGFETRKGCSWKYTRLSLDLTKDRWRTRKLYGRCWMFAALEYLPSQNDCQLPVGFWVVSSSYLLLGQSTKIPTGSWNKCCDSGSGFSQPPKGWPSLQTPQQDVVLNRGYSRFLFWKIRGRTQVCLSESISSSN